MNKASLLMIPFFLCICGGMLLSGCGNGTSSDKLISQLKTFKGSTTYEQVEKVLGQPARTYAAKRSSSGSINQTIEWKSNDGNVQILFTTKTSRSPQRVTRVEYVNDRGEKAYSYILLQD